MPLALRCPCTRLAVILVSAALASGAQAQVPASAGHVNTSVDISYGSVLSIATTIAGRTYSGDSWTSYLSDFQYSFDRLGPQPAAPLTAMGTASGDPVLSPATVSAVASAGSAAGVNQARVQVSGFERQVWSSTTTAACTTLDGVHCLPGQPAQTQQFSGSNSAGASALTAWRDAFRTAGQAGTLTLTFDARAMLSAEPNGGASLYWSQFSSEGDVLANIWAQVDGAEGVWSLDVYSNLDGFRSLSGTGPLSFGAGAVALASDGTSFDGMVHAGLGVAAGDRFGLTSQLQAYVGGNGQVDVSEGIRLTRIGLPAGSRIQSQSGIDYGGLAAPVPEPMPAALLLSGLAMLGWLRRRRGAA